MTGCLLLILGFLALVGIELLVTTGVIYLITLCFGLAFSWKMAIGIWLVIALLTGIFGGKK